MEIIALVLALLAVGLFLFEQMKINWTSFTPLGLALFAGAFAAYMVHLLEEGNKL